MARDRRCACCAQDTAGQARLALRYAWWIGDIVDLSLLTCPRIEPKHPRQIFWQADLCQNGERFVTGAMLSCCMSEIPGHGDS